MKAIIRTEYGGTEQVRLGERPDPVAGRGQVLVEVRAAGLDRGVWHLMHGEPRLVRLGIGVRRPRQPILGRDLAGVVVALGEGVTGLALGDEVLGTSAHGTLAELAPARVDRLVRKPSGWTFEEAAALPISGLTALQAVQDVGRIQPGQRVLVVGASGGVGSFAVQLARHAGADVDAVCGSDKNDLVRELGAELVTAYGEGADLPGEGAAGPRYDVVLDIGGARPLQRLRSVLTPRGTLVLVGGERGGRWLDGLHRQLTALLISPVSAQRLAVFLATEQATELARLVALVEDGACAAVLDGTWSLVDAPAALDHLAEGRARGKVVVTV
ncbi:MAG: NAD(P)-dependent alcohol dehydrogenase [Nocardioides sp.]